MGVSPGVSSPLDDACESTKEWLVVRCGMATEAIRYRRRGIAVWSLFRRLAFEIRHSFGLKRAQEKTFRQQ